MDSATPRAKAARRRRIVPALLALGLSAALAGCISLGGKVPDTMLRLTAEQTAPAGALGGGPVASALVVMEPETDRSLAVLRVPVRIDGARLAYLKNAVWVERPARQFRSVLAETLRARTGRLVTEGPELLGQAGQVLDGSLLDMGYDAQAQAVVVRYDAFLRGRDGTVKTRRFESRATGVVPDANSVAPALNRAANEVAIQVSDWINASGT
ncbi:ABC-type transport auxiliary lipoprotein family protein [Novosphingobium colocasiae]|uniref:ABC-type transport auxiliary lipoprotein component domain-containing protein n=1 Tax=Novosphingobium colocasiae TaxID=1256513 RepID=A0A918UG01_9SPHN|nr:ABC-type transport auxiliary lipoprotein family protein [Novosphingobium colocasiae]GGZ06547.1 hypothetical protein GCM10011614_21870 [Novosphingobium colocasiae]